MKFTLFSVAVWFAIGFAAPAWADPIQAEPTEPIPGEATKPVQVETTEPIQGGAADLLLPEEETPGSFQYDTDELEQLSTQINHSVTVNDESTIQLTQSSQDFNSPDGVLTINSDGNVTGRREIP